MKYIVLVLCIVGMVQCDVSHLFNGDHQHHEHEQHDQHPGYHYPKPRIPFEYLPPAPTYLPPTTAAAPRIVSTYLPPTTTTTLAPETTTQPPTAPPTPAATYLPPTSKPTYRIPIPSYAAPLNYEYVPPVQNNYLPPVIPETEPTPEAEPEPEPDNGGYHYDPPAIPFNF